MQMKFTWPTCKNLRTGFKIKKETVEKAAEIYAYLKKEGNLIENVDILMDAIAIVEDLVLISNNISHFKRVKSLRLDNWLQN